jgi:hypothetical protein
VCAEAKPDPPGVSPFTVGELQSLCDGPHAASPRFDAWDRLQLLRARARGMSVDVDESWTLAMLERRIVEVS